MQALVAEYGTIIVLAAFGVMFIAGFVKGVVGFALPMVTISGVGSLMSAEVAIAAIILPALVTNVQQALRQGIAAARQTLRTYWRLNLMMLLTIGLFAQLVVLLPDRVLFIILGGMVTVFGTLQLIGFRPRFPPERTGFFEWLTGLVAGFFGGLSAVWGPPILMYLLARDTPKVQIVRAQGISFLIGSVVLLIAHVPSGLLDASTGTFSALMILPALAGMWIGFRVQDQLDQDRFKTATLVVLVLAGLNLLRRGLF